MSGWILQSTDEAPIILRLPTGSIRTIGRTARADFIVDAALISRLHCRLTAERSNQLVVEDLGSTNGTLVNGERVVRQVLREGDVLTVGRVKFTVSGSAGATRDTRAATPNLQSAAESGAS
jgi:pSer/pThr/pTyr-binding forkhead associated (FHA) protein